MSSPNGTSRIGYFLVVVTRHLYHQLLERHLHRVLEVVQHDRAPLEPRKLARGLLPGLLASSSLAAALAAALATALAAALFGHAEPAAAEPARLDAVQRI